MELANEQRSPSGSNSTSPKPRPKLVSIQPTEPIVTPVPEADAPVAKGLLQKRPVQIVLGFCAGIGVALVIMAVQTQFSTGDSALIEQSDGPAVAQSPVPEAIVAQPETNVEAAIGPETSVESSILPDNLSAPPVRPIGVSEFFERDVEMALENPLTTDLPSLLGPAEEVEAPVASSESAVLPSESSDPRSENSPANLVPVDSASTPALAEEAADPVVAAGPSLPQVAPPDFGSEILRANLAPAELSATFGSPDEVADPIISDRQISEVSPTEQILLSPEPLATELAGAEIALAESTSVSAPVADSLRGDARALPTVAGPAPLDAASPAAFRPELLLSLTAELQAIGFNADTGIAAVTYGADRIAYGDTSKLTAAPAQGSLPVVDLAVAGQGSGIVGAEEMAVWIFAAASVGDAKVDTALAKAEGFNLTVRGVDRVGYRISSNQIRYYDTASAAAANQLAAEIGAIPRDFTDSGANPPPGTLEIYLAGVGGTSQPSAGAANAVPARRTTGVEALRANVISRLRRGISR